MEPFLAGLTNPGGHRSDVLVLDLRFDPVNPPQALVTTPDRTGSPVLVSIERLRSIV